MVLNYVGYIVNTPPFFDFMVYSREIFNVFSDLTKTLTLAFSWTVEKLGLSNSV